MFRRFAFQFQGPGDEEWSPPWLREEGPRPRFFAMRRGHGPFGPGGPFGFRGEGHRMFGRGDMKFALLELLQERPMHGYEMMKALEEQSGGFYSPSPGSIYPTLQMLEDRGLVSGQEVEGKRVYSITDAGRAALVERQHVEASGDEGSGERHLGDGVQAPGGRPAGPPWMRQRGRHEHRPAPEMQALRSETVEVMRLFAIAGRMALQDPQQLARLRATVERTRKELSDIIYGAGSQQGQSPSTATE